MTSSDDGQPKAPGRKQSRLWLALCWAAVTIVSVITALDNGRPLWWFSAGSAGGATIVFATHPMSFASLATSVVRVEHGRVV